jgi:glycosyltransferase involved in cell wall biosynthesis
MNIIDNIFLRLKHEDVIYNYNKYCDNEFGNALLYYKTIPFASKKLVKEYVHPNNWRVLEMTKVLNELGFVVDIVGRNKRDFEPRRNYDLFIGIFGARGHEYAEIAKKLPSSTIKILYATIANPEIMNRSGRRRKQSLKERRGVDLKFSRGKEVDMKKTMDYTDYIFCTGNHEYTIKTYDKFNKKTYKINPNTNPLIKCTVQEILNRERNPRNFLFFAGNGLLHKGLDLLLEVFKENPKLTLYICAPLVDEDFIQEYEQELFHTPNIHTIGFINTESAEFYELTSKCCFVVLPSCSEAGATSVLTCMRRGLIPVVTKETGVDRELGTIHFRNDSIYEINRLINELAHTNKKDLLMKSYRAFLGSFNYTQRMFTQTFQKAVISAIYEKNGLKIN